MPQAENNHTRRDGLIVGGEVEDRISWFAAITLAGRGKRRPYAVLGDIEALPSRLPTLYRRLTE